MRARRGAGGFALRRARSERVWRFIRTMASSTTRKGAGVLSDLVVCYLFLGGAGAGLGLVLSVLGLLVPRECAATLSGTRLHPSVAYRKLLGCGFVAAFVVLALGIACLLADLGNAERVILLLLQPAVSYLTVGSWALVICLALVAALGLAWLGVGAWSVALVRILHVAVALVALAVMAYTGLLLQSLGAVPLWSTPWLPALFVASSLSCGIACVLALAQLTGAASAFRTVLGRLAAVDAAVIAVEAAIVAVFVYAASLAGAPLSNGTELAAAQSVRELVAGANAQLFWSGFVAFGLTVPFVLDVVLARPRRPLPGVALFAAACVLGGGFVMRFCVVAAGAHPVLSSMGVM